MSSKVKNMKVDDIILSTNYGHANDDYVAVASYRDPDYDADGVFVITLHHGRMPWFASEEFATAEACEARMRELQPDLRKWRKVN